MDIGTSTAGADIPVSTGQFGLAITPEGNTAHVANYGSGTVTPIDAATNLPGTPITVGGTPFAIAFTPDGKTAYVPDPALAGVIPMVTNTAGAAIPLDGQPR